jgi:hypothetical protein
MKYVMLIAQDPRLMESFSDEERKAAYDEIWQMINKWEARGKLVAGGAELETPRSAKTIRRAEGGGVTITDGPYVDIKEVIGGFMRIEADSMEEALEVASDWPGIQYGAAVEVRPVVIH